MVLFNFNKSEVTMSSNILGKYVNKTLSLFPNKYKTLNDFLVIYKEIINSKQITSKTIENRLRYLKYLEESFGERSISSIQPHEVQKLVSNLLKQHESTAKRVMIEAKSLFNEAMNYRWITFNPIATIRLPKVKVKRKRITLSQFKLILEDCKTNSPPWVWHLLMLAVLTGQRRSDLIKMKFSDIWEEDNESYLHVTQAKTGSLVSIPLSIRCKELDISLNEVIDSCKLYYRTPSDLLIRKSNGSALIDSSLSFRFMETRNRVFPETKHDLTAFSLHELRSLSERLYRDQGIDTRILLGHSTQRMTDSYNNTRGIEEKTWKKVRVGKKTSE